MKKVFILFFIFAYINIANANITALQFCDKNEYIKYLNKESGGNWKGAMSLALMFQGIQLESQNLDIDVFFIEKFGNNIAKCGIELKNKDNIFSETTVYHRIIGERSKFADNFYEL